MPFALYMLGLAVFVMGTSEFMLAGLLPAIAAELDVPMGTVARMTRMSVSCRSSVCNFGESEGGGSCSVPPGTPRTTP